VKKGPCLPNIGLEPTLNSLRSRLAAAVGRGSGPAFGIMLGPDNPNKEGNHGRPPSHHSHR
jgi:hypothetical protein